MDSLRAIFKKPEYIFLIFGLVFGLLFMILTPPFQVPDEQSHLHRAVEVANGVFYNKNVPEISELDKILQENPLIKPHIRGLTDVFHTVSGYSPVMYVTSAIGIKVGALFKMPLLMFYLARLFNLLSWLCLTYFAIKITPVFKWHFLLFALLPMSIYEGMSISADSFVNGFLFLFFAYMFKLIFEENERLSHKEIIVYFLMTLISSLLKGCLIYPAFLMLFVKDKRKWLLTGTVLALSVCIGGVWAANNYIALGPEGNPEVNKAFIFSHPFEYFIIFCKTLVCSSYYWLKGYIGIFGLLSVRFPQYLYWLTILIYTASFAVIPVEKYISKRLRISAFGLILLYMLIVLTALYCTWTPAGANHISCFQGRYLICISPLIFLALGHYKRVINIQKYITYYLIYVFMLLVYACFVLYNVYHFS